MTEIVTTSFREYRPDMGQPVSIALTVPRDMPEAKEWPTCWVLTPRWSYFHSPYAEYDAAFCAQLERFGVAKINRALHAIAREAGAERLVLCCWEPAGVAESRCHRRLAAAWWLYQTGEPWPEATTGG